MGTGNSGKFKSTLGSLKPEHLMEELRNFKGVISPDFSLYRDMPNAI